MTAPDLRFRGALASLSPADRAALFDRVVPGQAEIRDTVRRILATVAAEGDPALVRLARELDGAELERLEVPRAAWRAALEATPGAIRGAMERAARNLVATHSAWRPAGSEVEPEPGILVGRRADPVDRVGVYAPGGRAAYPSSVLMAAVPARVAGVREVVVCSPPDGSGAPARAVLAACDIAGVDRVFALGGAGAIGALAFGTASVPRVDRIVGPGNAYVMEAKLQVSDRVGIDGPAGPSEVLVLADRTAPPDLVAREMVAQAEHDPRAAAVAVVIGSPADAIAVEAAVARAASAAPRRDIVLESLRAAGGVLQSSDLEEAIEFAGAYAPEHLLLALDDADRHRDRFRNAGSIFVGLASSIVFGDYLTGANHVLPTGGLARAYSGLVPEDFIRWTTYQRVTPDAARRLAADAALLATAEGLPGHAAAARAWENAR